MMDKKYDNDDNPYLKFKLHRYSNMPNDLKGDKRSEDIIVPLVHCKSIDADHLWWEKSRTYCP